jgi:putative transposon-encoded protein
MKVKFTNFIYMNIYSHVMRKIAMTNGKLKLTDDIDIVYEKQITKFGTGAKIDAPKEFIGKKVYVLIRK